MAYSNFAYYYDLLNQAADYDALYSKIIGFLGKASTGKIIVDLGCGTGEIALRLAKDNFDVIAVDASLDMLTVAREKAWEQEHTNILFLNQKLQNLDFYGTIHGAVATFDTLNHIAPKELDLAIQKISLFMEDDSLFIFDVNSPYKHEKILANNTFLIEIEDEIRCEWKNTYKPKKSATEIALRIFENNEIVCTERFLEYSYSLPTLENILRKNKFNITVAIDGETFKEITTTSPRFLVVATKKPEGKRSL